MSSGGSDAGAIMAGGVVITGVLAISAVMTVVGAIVAAVMAMISTIVMVVGIVGGVAVLGVVAPNIIRAVGDARAATLRATYGPVVERLEAAPGDHTRELEQLRQRLQMLELRTAPVNRELER